MGALALLPPGSDVPLQGIWPPLANRGRRGERPPKSPGSTEIPWIHRDVRPQTRARGKQRMGRDQRGPRPTPPCYRAPCMNQRTSFQTGWMLLLSVTALESRLSPAFIPTCSFSTASSCPSVLVPALPYSSCPVSVLPSPHCFSLSPPRRRRPTSRPGTTFAAWAEQASPVSPTSATCFTRACLSVPFQTTLTL